MISNHIFDTIYAQGTFCCNSHSVYLYKQILAGSAIPTLNLNGLYIEHMYFTNVIFT